MTYAYTPDEHRDAAEAIKTLVRKHPQPSPRPPGWGEIGLYGAPNEFDLAKAALDAVLPGYTQRARAEALGDAVDVIEDSDDKTEALERVQMLRQDVARAAALAAPAEPTPLCRETLDQNGVTYRCSMLSGHDENFHQGVPLPLAWTAPPVEQP